MTTLAPDFGWVSPRYCFVCRQTSVFTDLSAALKARQCREHTDGVVRFFDASTLYDWGLSHARRNIAEARRQGEMMEEW